MRLAIAAFATLAAAVAPAAASDCGCHVRHHWVRRHDVRPAYFAVRHTAYVPTTRYVPQTNYVPQTSYVPHTEYERRTTYVPRTVYVPQTSYVPHTRYEPTTTYAPRTSYVPETTYEPRSWETYHPVVRYPATGCGTCGGDEY